MTDEQAQADAAGRIAEAIGAHQRCVADTLERLTGEAGLSRDAAERLLLWQDHGIDVAGAALALVRAFGEPAAFAIELHVLPAAEFERRYAERSGLTVDELRAHGRTVIPCPCGEDGCEGWQSVSTELAADPFVRFKAGIGPAPDAA